MIVVVVAVAVTRWPPCSHVVGIVAVLAGVALLGRINQVGLGAGGV